MVGSSIKLPPSALLSPGDKRGKVYFHSGWDVPLFSGQSMAVSDQTSSSES